MALQCNIDARGKFIRLIYGLVITFIGIALAIFWAWPGGGWLAWTISMLCILGGGFVLFEARAGWCAARAMGLKTPF